MQQFSHGIEASDQALVRAQAKLGAEVDKFADSLQRWTSFEDEMRRFYGSVEAHQKQMTEEHRTLEYMLSSYRDFVRQATGVLENSATTIGTAAGQLPAAFNTSADRMTKSTTDFQNSVSTLIADLATKLEEGNRKSQAELQQRFEDVLGPVLKMEDRLRALAEPFERTAHEFTEIATNLWKLNENFSREVTRKLSDTEPRS
jgi:ABC-type transporter Mla subunit MlaD